MAAERSTRWWWRACLRWALVTVTLLYAGLALASERWVDTHFTTADGLPVDSVRAAAIGGDGFLWLATYDGLVRFDGRHFDVYDAANVATMTDNRVKQLFKAANGSLYSRSEHGEWLRVAANGVQRVPLGGNQPAVLHVDEASMCLTTERALRCMDADGGFPVRTEFPQGARAMLALPAAQGGAWLVDDQARVWRKQDQHWKQMARLPDDLELRGYRPATVDTHGRLWTSFGGRLQRVSVDGSIKVWRGADAPWGVLRLREGGDGRLWVDSGNGVFRVQAGTPQRVFGHATPPKVVTHGSWRAPDGALWLMRGGKLWRMDHLPAPGETLPPPVLESPGSVTAILFGRHGAVWVMSRRDGVHRLTRARVRTVGSAIEHGLNVYSIARGAGGDMWLGTLDQNLVRINGKGQHRIFGPDDGLPGVDPWLVAASPGGDIYVGPYGSGLWHSPSADERFQPVPMPSALSPALLHAIRFDRDGNLWVGGTAGVWRRRAGQWRKIWPQGKKQVEVNALWLANGVRWFGGQHGLWRQTHHDSYAVAPDLLDKATVRNLYRDATGTLWVSTGGRGLIRIAGDDPHGAHAVRLGRRQGLPSNSPHAVRVDARGNIWVNSNQGIFRIAGDDIAAFLAGHRERLAPLLLGLPDGVTSLEGNGGLQPGAASDAQGHLWFPTQRGAVVFDPLAISLHAPTPETVIDRLNAGESGLHPMDGTALPRGIRSLEIQYAAADLQAGSAVRYRYRLLPQDRDWHAVGSQRSVRLAQLGPGAYRFQVMAGNSSGDWPAEPTTLAFSVPAFWYETGWFRGMIAVLLLLAAWFALARRNRRLRAQAEQLESEVKARTAELQQQKQRTESTLAQLTAAHQDLEQGHQEIKDRNQRLAEQRDRLQTMDQFRRRVLADVSHELRTPIMLVSLPMRELRARAGALKPADRRHLDLSLQHLDRLAALIEQLVGLVQAEAGQIHLRAKRVDLAGLLDEIIRGFEPMAQQAKVRVALDAGEVPGLFGDRQHLVTIFGNLIDNALKHAPENSMVRVAVRQAHDLVHISVSDAGPGFDEGQALRLFERFYRADTGPKKGREGLGVGLALARELVQLHGGTIRAASEPGQGACFTVALPLGSAHIALDDLVLDDHPIDAPLPAPDDAVGGQRVLLVEDHPDLAAYIAERLGEYLPVTRVGSAEEAAQALACDDSIRLVLSDVVLPGRSGLELCHDITAGVAPVSCPVILISARAADSDRDAGLAAGAVTYLAKPFGFDTLLKAITRAWPGAAGHLDQHVAAEDDVDPLLALALGGMSDPDFTVSSWAEQAHLSPRQLRRRVKELAGQTPQAWLREQRLLKVRHLIREGSCRTLAEAGSCCGMDNTAYLYRIYHARFGEPTVPPAPRSPD